MDLNISDHQIAGPVAKKISIEISEIVLNSYAMIRVSFEDETGGCVKNEHLKMEGADYDAWGNDDNYVKTWVLTKLSLTAA